MTPDQETSYGRLRDAGWEYDHTEESGAIAVVLWSGTPEAMWVTDRLWVLPCGTISKRQP